MQGTCQDSVLLYPVTTVHWVTIYSTDLDMVLQCLVFTRPWFHYPLYLSQLGFTIYSFGFTIYGIYNSLVLLYPGSLRPLIHMYSFGFTIYGIYNSLVLLCP